MSSRPEKEKACSAPPKSQKRPYASGPGSGRGRTARRTTASESRVRVILPDEPPRLTPEAARVMLRILLKAHARLADDNPREGAE
jgi:hypothetical protein